MPKTLKTTGEKEKGKKKKNHNFDSISFPFLALNTSCLPCLPLAEVAEVEVKWLCM